MCLPGAKARALFSGPDGQRKTETEGNFMRLMFCNVGQGDRGPFSSSAATGKLLWRFVLHE